MMEEKASYFHRMENGERIPLSISSLRRAFDLFLVFPCLSAAIQSSSSLTSHVSKTHPVYVSVSLHFPLLLCAHLSPPPTGTFVYLHLKHSKRKGVVLFDRLGSLAGMLRVCVYVCVTAAQGKGVMNSSVKQQHTTACRSIFNKISAVHKRRKN